MSEYREQIETDAYGDRVAVLSGVEGSYTVADVPEGVLTVHRAYASARARFQSVVDYYAPAIA